MYIFLIDFKEEKSYNVFIFKVIYINYERFFYWCCNKVEIKINMKCK